MRSQVRRNDQRQGPNAHYQSAILRRHRRRSEGIRDTGKLLGAAPCEGGTDGTTMAEGSSSKTLKPQPAGQPQLPRITTGPLPPEWWTTSNGIVSLIEWNEFLAAQETKKRNDANG